MDYKKYSLEQLDNWVHDAISSAEASPQEIYDTIKKVVEEQYYYYKDGASRTYELLALLNGNGSHFNINIDPGGNDVSFTYGDDIISFGEQIQNSLNNSWEEHYYPEEHKVNKWILPVELDGLTGDCIVTLPDDMLDQLGWKEGDTLEYTDNKDGSFTIKKENKVGTI